MGDLEDIKETPEEIAATFTCAMFETPQDVLKGARHMVHLFLSSILILFSLFFFICNPETEFSFYVLGGCGDWM